MKLLLRNKAEPLVKDSLGRLPSSLANSEKIQRLLLDMENKMSPETMATDEQDQDGGDQMDDFNRVNSKKM